MARGYTKEQRKEASEAYLNTISTQLVIEGKRIYLEQKLQYGGNVKVDATGLYYFLKDMFTTEWQESNNV